MRILFVFLACSWALSGVGQSSVADSLRVLVVARGDDTTKVKMYRDLGHCYVYSRPDSCYYYTSLGLAVARKIGDREGESFCLSLIGATEAYIGNYVKALAVTLNSLQIAEKFGDGRAVCDALGSMTAVYYFQKDYDKALSYTRKEIQIAESLRDSGRISLQLGNLASIFLEMSRLDSALQYSLRAYRFSLLTNALDELPGEKNVLADIYFRSGNQDLALAYYRQVLSDAIKSGNQLDFCTAALGISVIFQKRRQYDSALVYAYRSRQAALDAGFIAMQINTDSSVAAIYAAQKKMDSAYTYLKQVVVLSDSLFGQAKSKSIQEMTFAENIRQLELAQQTKEQKERDVRNIQLTGIAVFIPIFFLIVIFLAKIRVKPRVVEFLAIVNLLLFFEFITDLVFPYISDWTNDRPVWEMLILVLIAAFIEPINFRVERWIKLRLVKNPAPPRL